MTAAHCIDSSHNVQVIAGTNHPGESPDPDRQVAVSTSLVPHEMYNAVLISNDIGIIELDDDPLVFNGKNDK